MKNLLTWHRSYWLAAILAAVFSLCQYSCSKDPAQDLEVSIFDLNPPAEYDTLMASLKPEKSTKTASFLWFTDIHGNAKNLTRILAWHERYKECFDDVISTGDQQSLLYTDDFSWWEKNGAGGVLQVVGNHDVWLKEEDYETGDYEGKVSRKYGHYYIMSQKEVYRSYFSPYISNWNITQPSSADSLGLCYYYKDYGDLRLIVLDYAHYAVADDLDANKKSRQNRWLITTLNDAKKKNLSVMAVSHLPVANTIPYECSYTRPNSTGRYSECLNSNAYKNVSTFLDEGGEFVCWLAGHGHYDEIGVIEADPRQLVIRCAIANNERANERNNDYKRPTGTKSQDSFNCMSIDTENKQINIVKVGNDVNQLGARKRVLRYNYKDHTDASGVLHKRGVVYCY